MMEMEKIILIGAVCAGLPFILPGLMLLSHISFEIVTSGIIVYGWIAKKLVTLVKEMI